jgi:hypothetical protein
MRGAPQCWRKRGVRPDSVGMKNSQELSSKTSSETRLLGGVQCASHGFRDVVAILMTKYQEKLKSCIKKSK